MAGEGDAERLVVLLEARIRDFEKNMQKAGGSARRNFGDMRNSSRSATRQMETDMQRSTSRINQMLATTSTRIGSLAKAFAGGLAIGGASELIRQVGTIARGIASIGDEAKRAGLGVKEFQELRYVAEQNRIGVDALVDGIKELNLRADEFIVTGKGPAAEAFARLGYGAEELREKLKNPKDLLIEIIGRLQQLDKAAQIRIADEIFGGTAGERFVELIAQGEQGIRDTIKAAHDFGAVMDEKMIAKAAELDRKFNAVATTVGTALKTAIVEAADALQRFIDYFRQVQDQSTVNLEARLNELMTRRAQLQEQKGNWQDWGLSFIGKDAETELKAVDEELAKITAELRQRALPRLRAELLAGQAPAVKGNRPGYADRVVAAENNTGNSAARNPRSTATGDGQFIESTWLALFRKHFPAEAANMSTAAILELRKDSARSRQMIELYAQENAAIMQAAGISVDEVAKQLAHFLGPQGAIAVLKANSNTPITQLLGEGVINANPEVLGGGKTAADVIAYAERRAGAVRQETQAVKEATDACEGLREVTSQTGDATVQTTAVIEQQAQSYSQLGQAAQTTLQGIASALSDGKITTEEWLQILIQVAQQLASMPSGGLGGGGGSLLNLIGSIFSFDEGGYTGPGGKRQPAGIVHKGEVVWSQADIRRAGGVGVVEAMRHGAVGMRPMQAAPSARNDNLHVTVGVSVDDDGKVQAYVNKISERNSRAAVQVAVQESQKITKRNMPGMLADVQARRL